MVQSAMIEPMEPRLLMAAAPAAVAVDAAGTLTVWGGVSANVIEVRESGGVVSVVLDGRPMGLFGGAKRVVIDGGGGRDTISYAGESVAAEVLDSGGSDLVTLAGPAGGGSVVYGPNDKISDGEAGRATAGADAVGVIVDSAVATRDRVW